MSKPSEPTLSPKPGQPAKPYQSPTLRAYGDIHDITRGTGTVGARDSAGRPRPNKTSP